MKDLISRKKLLEQIEADSEGREGQYGDEWLFIDTINAMPTAEPKGREENETILVQMPTIKQAKSIERVVVYADTCKQEYYMLKVGKWIETSEGTMCSNCHKFPYDDGEYHIANWHSDYCPHCGAKMERSE